MNRRDSGHDAESRAQRLLERRGLRLVGRNFTTRGGELDLIMDAGGTLVFVEVRYRADSRHGSALESIGATKRWRIIRAARVYLQQRRLDCPCRFDVVALDGDEIEWIPGAFQAD